METQQINPQEFMQMKQDMAMLKEFMKSMQSLKEDLEFARRTEEAHQRIESGDGIEMEFDDFIDEMKKW